MPVSTSNPGTRRPSKAYSECSLADFHGTPDVGIQERAEAFWHYTRHVRSQGHYNYRRVSTSGSGPTMQVFDETSGRVREYVNLASNDYLNLTKHPDVVSAGIEATRKYGSGAGSVPLLGGTLDIHMELERKVSRFKGCEDAILYTSGFGSNCSTILSLLGEGALAVLDTLVHASIVDGCSRSTVRKFRHNDPESLDAVLRKSGGAFRSKLVIVDGVYSMDGDIARLDEILDVAKRHGALVMVDEAHASGVIGAHGRGTPEHFGLEGRIDLVAGTFSKALGSVGGFIAASKEIVELLRFYSRGYMFSTAMTPQATASLLAALDVVESDEALRSRLWANIRFFRGRLLDLGFEIGASETAIFPVIVGDDFKVKEAVRRLHVAGVYANPVLYPAVRRNQSRIRMTVTAGHRIEDLERAIEAMLEIDRDLRIRKA